MASRDDSPDLRQKVDNLTVTVNNLCTLLADYLQTGDGKGRRRRRDEDEDDFTVDYSKDENEERGNWSGRFDFVLACLGAAVGLGNVWRFPYLCFRNGGAVFLIPYVIMLAVVGMPIFLLELSLGQYTSQGVFTCWEMAVMFKGVGFAMVFVSTMVAIYYNVVIGWSFFYLFAGFQKELPWESCNPEWASEWCLHNVNRDFGSAQNCTIEGFTAGSDGACYNTTAMDMISNVVVMAAEKCKEAGFMYSVDGTCYNSSTPVGFHNYTLAGELGLSKVLPTSEYLIKRVLGAHKADTIQDMGEMRWEIVLC